MSALVSPVVLVAGVDEAGRGPLAGPVVAGAVVLDPRRPIDGLADSKLLDRAERERLAVLIRTHAFAWHVARASVAEIDTLNILHASMLAMRRAVLGLPVRATEVLVDGNRCPDLPMPARAIVKGDQLVASISAASILAKVCRDGLMRRLACRYPEFAFERHKGYPTRAHRVALEAHGPSAVHRRSFAPVRRLLVD